jgi:hypothetical protein
MNELYDIDICPAWQDDDAVVECNFCLTATALTTTATHAAVDVIVNR